MYYDDVLLFVRNLLKNSHIPTIIFEEPFEHAEILDMGFRESLIENYDPQEIAAAFPDIYKPNVLYYLTDIYYCSYVCMQLPNPRKKQYFIVGPFTYIDINKKTFLKILKDFEIPPSLLPFVENYYYNLAFINSETQFKNLMSTLAETLWNGCDNYSISKITKNPLDFPEKKLFIKETTNLNYLMPINANVVEARYNFENRCMQAVSQGNLTLIDQLFSNAEEMRFIPRLANSLRDYKNYMVVFNTLLRKAAEQGAVHPVYLDQLSSKYAQRIETLTTPSDHELEREMIYKYCLLVRNYSVKGYSPILQKVINQINLNLTSDLGLKNLSEMFNISAGYLSTLFKRETGITLTDYVNKKRIEHAIFLLNTTNMQIQAIASYCGIQDINYFTRIFKKFNGITPKAYKELISKPYNSHKEEAAKTAK